MKISFILLVSMIVSLSPKESNWGFFSHQRINRLAVFTLPIEMIEFYKKNIQYLTEKAVNPDKRRYLIKEEAARHYIDIDVYGDSAIYKMPRYWRDAVEAYTEDTLKAYGIVPYHINRVAFRLVEAFKNNDAEGILRLSADLGHYIGDANVPLHTTENYNGQLTGQYGIHGLWESRLPELFFEDYDLLTGTSEYKDNLQLYAWEAVQNAHIALDSVLAFELKASDKLPESRKYAYVQRGNILIKTHSYKFSKLYHNYLSGMVERRMRASIKMVGDFWYSCWVKAGQPDLSSMGMLPTLQDSIVTTNDIKNLRNHESAVQEKN